MHLLPCFSLAISIYFRTSQHAGHALPTILPILSKSLPLILTVGLICSTSAREPLHPARTDDSSSVRKAHISAKGQSGLDSVTISRPTVPGRVDSAARSDTLGRTIMPSFIGTIDRSLGSSDYVTQDDLHWIDYKSLGGIVETEPGVYVRSQSSVGQYDQPNFRGYDWRGIGILSNGRLLNDPASGIYNLFHFSPEYAYRVEIITGPRAFLFGLNS